MIMKKLALPIVAIAALFTLTSAATNYFEISKYLEIFIGVYKNLNTYYVDEIDPEELVMKGIDAMLEDLDPYSDYVPSEEVEDFNTQSSGEYGGIGATVRKTGDYIAVVSPFEGSPADQVGLQAGDKFLKISGKDVKGKSSNEVISLLKGEPGTPVEVTIGRGDEEFDRTIVREVIKIKNVTYSGMVDDGIAYVKLSSFTDGAGEEVSEAINNLKANNEVTGLILDLKGNGGGLLSEAINVTNVFVPKGEPIVSIKTRSKSQDRTYRTRQAATDDTTPLVVLIDGNTASASEIVSGSVQDLDRGVIIGRNSFGKGLVQSTRDMAYDSKLKLTTAKYLIPSGRCVQRLNYSEKDADGNPKALPDSLRTAFKTKNGRTVYDGSGVMPDIEVEIEAFPEVSFALFAKNYIYDYSIKYKEEHEAIANPEEFVMTDAEYEDFKQFVSDKDYSYQTETEEELEDLREAAEEEKLSDAFYEQLADLEEQLEANKKDDLDNYKDEIKFLLEREIAARYYYTAGRIANSLDDDDEVKKAIEILNNKAEYNSLLQP